MLERLAVSESVNALIANYGLLKKVEAGLKTNKDSIRL